MSEYFLSLSFGTEQPKADADGKFVHAPGALHIGEWIDGLDNLPADLEEAFKWLRLALLRGVKMSMPEAPDYPEVQSRETLRLAPKYSPANRQAA